MLRRCKKKCRKIIILGLHFKNPLFTLLNIVTLSVTSSPVIPVTPHAPCVSSGPLLLDPYHTIVSELEPFPVKKSQKLAAADCLVSSCGVCLTQMLFSVEPLRLEQLPLLPPPRVKPNVEPRVPLRSRELGSGPWSLEDEEGWARLSRLWWEWNWRMWRMDLPGGTSPGGLKQEKFHTCTTFWYFFLFVFSTAHETKENTGITAERNW